MNNELSRIEARQAALTAVLVEQIAEIRAAIATHTFVSLNMLEHMGADPDALLNAVDKMMRGLSDRIENTLRKRLDLEPRAEPRKPMMEDIAADGPIIDWSSVKEH